VNAPGPLIILGGGQHALVVGEAALAAGWTLAGLLDDSADADDVARTLGVPRLGRLDDLPAALDATPGPTAIHAAAGDPALRRAMLDRADASGRLPAAIVHPAAVVSPSAAVGDGVFVGATAVVNARARLARGVIVNSGAVVEHDCVVDAFAHIAPGAVLAGGVTVGADTLVGAGAAVPPGVRLGRHVVLGAGAVATTDIPDDTRAAGVPARQLV
jgi:sugar O-acyltransferase (sialic acid O-acetyltransferase NeuD family)